eukprot:6541603-Prorocentrum_lima.AAC.1
MGQTSRCGARPRRPHAGEKKQRILWHGTWMGVTSTGCAPSHAHAYVRTRVHAQGYSGVCTPNVG